MKTTAKTHSLIVAVLAGASFLSPSLLHGQTTITLDGTSGSNSISTSYSTTGGLTLSMGFFVEYLVIGGGGGGAGRDVGGGGGAGGYRSSVIGELSGGNSGAEAQLNLVTAPGNPTQTYAVTVGAGGAGGTDATNQRHGRDGGNSSFAGVIAIGGGGARGYESAGSPNGGSGGGGDGLTTTSAGTGTAGQGFNGGTGAGSTAGNNYGGGGGGGAGQAGSNASSGSKKGGDGLASSITGTSVIRAGGGGGAGHRNASPTSSGAGGAGGGGSAPTTAGNNGGAGTANTGGGGGASMGTSVSGGTGGSGVVIVRYAGAAAGTGGTVSAGTGTAMGYTLHQFTTTGNSSLVITDDFSTRLGATLTTGIGGTGDLAYSGPGRLTLAADSTYVGDTMISAGTLQVGNGGTAGTLGTGAVSIAAGSTLAFNRSDTIVAPSGISGSGTLTQQGSGSLVFAADSTFAGTASITAGTLQVGNGGSTGSLGTADVVNNAGLVVNRTGSLTLGGAISGTGTLEQAGAGTTILTANNIYTGSTTVSSGTLQVGNGGTTGTLGSGAVSLATGSTLAFNRSDNISVINAISGAGGLVQSGGGDLTLFGNNTFSGGTLINNGMLVAGNDTALGTGAVTIAGGNLRLGTGVTIANQIVLDAASTPANTSLAAFLPVEYLVVGGGGGGGGDNGGGGGGGGVLSGSWQLTDTATAVAVGAGGSAGNASTAGSNGGNSSFATVTAIGGGRGASGNTGQPAFIGGSGGGGDGEANKTGAAGTAGQGFAGGNGWSASEGGGGGGGGAGAAGSNAVTRQQGGDGGSGLANSITGTTTFYGGGGGGGPDNNATATSLGGAGGGGGGALGTGVKGTDGLGGGGGGAGWNGTQANGGAGGSGTVVLRYFGAPLATGGTVTAGTGTAEGFTLHTFNNVGEDMFVLNAPIAAEISGSITGSGGFTWDSGGTLTLSGNNNYTGGTKVSGGRLVGSSASLQGAITNSAAVEFAQSAAGTYAGVMSGNGMLIKSGAGTLTLTGANTYSGGTTVTAGRLVGNATSLQGAIANSGVVEFNQSGHGVYAGAISGSGGLVQSGDGRLTLGGTNTYTGTTTVSAGELNVNGSIADSAVTVESGASLSGSGTVGAISGAGAVDPGNSPGILTAPSVDPSGGLTFNFEFTSLNPTYSDATASLNDVLRLTDATTPFVASLTSANAVNIFFNVATFEEEQVYTGGFFTDVASDFLNQLVDATFNYYVSDAGGSVSYGGENYRALGEGLSITLSTVRASGDFAGGTVEGQILQFEVVPEPSTYALLVLGAVALALHTYRQRRRQRSSTSPNA